MDGDTKARADKEQEYIDLYIEEGQWDRLYNHLRTTIDTKRSCWSSTPEETADKLSKEHTLVDPDGSTRIIRNMAKFCRDNKLSIGAMYCVVYGHITHHLGWTRVGAPKPKRHVFTDPEGNRHITYNIKQLCRQYKLCVTSMRNIALGTQKSYKQWTLENVEKPEPPNRTHTFVDPDGNTWTTDCLKRFCRENKLGYTGMLSMVNGKYKHHRQWHLPGNKPEPKPTYTLIDPNGRTIIVENLAQFCRENGLSIEGMRGIIRGTSKLYRGYSIPGQQNMKEKEYTLIDPDGSTRIIRNMAKFCRENGLCRNSMFSVVSGKQSHYKKWRLPGAKEPKIPRTTFTLISPDNTEITVVNLAKFCRENGLSVDAMRHVVDGTQKQHKNWRKKP